MSRVEPDPGREFPSCRKHKYIGISISLRDDLIEQIDQFAGEELPFSSRSAAIALLVAMGLAMGKENTGVARSGLHKNFDSIDERSHVEEHVRELAINSIESATV